MATVKTIVGVKQCVANLTRKAGDPSGVLEALAGLLVPTAATNSRSSRVQQLHYHHLAVKGLLSMAAHGKVCFTAALCPPNAGWCGVG
jgi:hypothetical protein